MTLKDFLDYLQQDLNDPAPVSDGGNNAHYERRAEQSNRNIF